MYYLLVVIEIVAVTQ